jgi:hypothetical protein
MSTGFDDRVRTLMQQVVDEAPPPPDVMVEGQVRLVQEPDPGRRFWVPAVAAATAIAILIGGVALFLRGSSDTATIGTFESASAPPSDSAATTPALPPVVITLTPAPDVEPLRMSTVIGDLEFVTYRARVPMEVPRNLVVTPHGPVAVDNHELWWSTDYETWQIVPFDTDAVRVAVVGEDVAVIGETIETRLAWDGDRWTERSRVEFPGPIGGQIAFGPRGVTAVAADGTTIYYSSDGTGFSTAERGPRTDVFVAAQDVPVEDRDYGDCRATFGATEAQIRTVLATEAGFVAFTSAAHPGGDVCAPLLWFSADGNTWDLVASDSPFGELSVVHTSDITERDGRFIAVGEMGGQGREEIHGEVWVSDDAVTWQGTEVGFRPGDLEAGEMGWMLGGDTGIEDFSGAWFSTDGRSWDGPHRMPEGLSGGWIVVPEIAVGSDTILATGVTGRTFVIGRLQNTD